jgi:hypothetical protein
MMAPDALLMTYDSRDGSGRACKRPQGDQSLANSAVLTKPIFVM